ncbi:hypothetical protein GZH47_33730 (plasmid) [Paenibacillus rhizovicinus]|uniref:Uncharacterized protein n=1 Tax=Paenibacillus rhizovicinus TaxID=2704463 RepID=A0A6C0PB94_9BACL|nr:hypothetical protein [Paenibacillus rhizovicinus]QHW35854.1 hypothetical protein GZH47_33730 [Paenibacillus rhizovicinus]
MLFSYYFDTEKTHRLECLFEVLSYNVKNNTKIELIFNMKISEIMNNAVKKSEFKLGTFNFDAPVEGDTKHDIDFLRTRFAPHQKWVFEAKNNKNTAESMVIGLISSTANINPLGLDITQISPIYDAGLKGNNLARLEQSYVPPVVQQTLLAATFDTFEYPPGFESSTAIYEPAKKYYDLQDFKQTLPEPIPDHSRFVIDVYLAPKSVSDMTETLFMLHASGVGTVYVTQNYIIFSVNGKDSSKQYNLPIDLTKLHDGTFFLSPSRLVVEGDGNGTLKVRYNETELTTTYDPSFSVQTLTFEGANTSSGAVETLIDNFNVTYYK